MDKPNFDKVINRFNTNCEKWDFAKRTFKLDDDDFLALWVADMDFKAPEPINNAIKKIGEHGIYGYTNLSDGYYNAAINWYKRRHKWNLEQEWFIFTPGIVSAINIIIKAFSEREDKIIIQNPIYYPFINAINNNNRKILYNPLKLIDNHYVMDFIDLKKKILSEKPKILILCSPHNPVGRVWTKKELIELGNLCINNNVLVIADEIHCDIVYKDFKHTPFASISKKFADNSITCTSASKTFNLAGLQASNIIIANENIRSTLKKEVEACGLYGPNSFASDVYETAYNECEGWFDSAMEYIEANLDFLRKFIKEKMPKIKLIEPEGTYLVWLDFRGLKLDFHEIERLMQKEAKVLLDEGYIFGPEGEGFERFNIACPRSILSDALERILGHF